MSCPSTVRFFATLVDVASVDVDTVGVVVGVSLASCVFLMIAVKSCRTFARLSFACIVCGTADLIAVRRSDAVGLVCYILHFYILNLAINIGILLNVAISFSLLIK